MKHGEHCWWVGRTVDGRSATIRQCAASWEKAVGACKDAADFVAVGAIGEDLDVAKLLAAAWFPREARQETRRDLL